MKKFFSILFTFTLLFSLYQSTSVFALNSDEDSRIINESTNIYKKLHFYIDKEEYCTIDSYDELIKATSYAIDEYATKQKNIALSRGDVFDSYHVTIEFVSNIKNTKKYKEILGEMESIKTMSDVRSFRRRLNSYSKEYHEQLIDDSIKTIEKLQYTSAEHIAYSPFVVLNTPLESISVDALICLAKQENTVNISISLEDEVSNELPPIEIPFEGETTADPNTWENALRTINAYDIVSEGTYTGELVRIGILEAAGICDIDNPGLANKEIIIRSQSTISDHATAVTLIASQIAPEAEFYVSKTSNFGFLSWFIENDCDVVNCSFGLHYSSSAQDNYQYQYNYDGIYDYQIDTHLITVVKSAGNKSTSENYYNPNNKITTPGYAFNVITVGGVYTNNSNNLVWHSTACYDSSIYPENKPNVSANFKITNVPYYYDEDGQTEFGGTSAAAPQVTGCIALLMSRYPALSCKPAAIHSLVASTATKTYNYSAGSLDGFDEKVGAGVINLEKMFENPNYTELYNASGEYGDILYSRTIYLNAGQEIQIAIAWLVEAYCDNDYLALANAEVYVTDYDLLLYFESGPIIESGSSCIYSNVEMLRSTITVSGTYTIVVVQAGDMDQNVEDDHIVLTYNYH